MAEGYALVTGASRGIGRAIAYELAGSGMNLYITCSNTGDELREIADDLSKKYGIMCIPFIGDMGNYKDVEKLFDSISDIDVLVNNAGISYIGLLSDLSVEDWQRLMDVNLNAAFYTSRLAVPMMLHKHSGRIINISSVWGSVGASMEVAYSTSKGGINAFTKALAKELAPSDIQVNAIACGVIDTDMNKCFSEEERETLIGEIPANRMGQPEEIAQTVLQLINAPSYLTGQIITVDGGWI